MPVTEFDLAFDVYPPEDPAGKVTGYGVAARLVRLTLDDQLIDGEYVAELLGTGSGFLEIHADNPDADLLQKDAYIQVVRMTGSLWMAEEKIGGFFLGRGFLKVLSAKEQSGRVVRWEGDGASAALDRYVLGHSVYATGQTLRGDRTVPGKWAWNDEPYGAMLVRVLEEGFDHPKSFYDFFDWDFTRSLDSNGNAWDETSDYQTAIGTSGLKLYADFLKLGLIAEVSPDLTVQAYRALDEYRTDRHSGTFAAGKVRFEVGTNIIADLLKRLNPASRRTDVLYEDRTGDYQTFDEDVNGNPIGGVPYMTYRKSTTTADDSTIQRMAAEYLTKLDQFVDVAKVKHLIGPGGIAGDEGYLPSPTGDYWLGDLVTIHTGTTELDYNEQTIEVAAIRYHVQGNQWMVEAELGAQYRDVQQQQVQGAIAQTIINQLQAVLLCEADAEIEQDTDVIGDIEVSGGTLVAADLPSGAQAGDVAVVLLGNVGLAATPAGGSPFTLLGSGGTTNDGPGSDFGFRVAYKFLTAPDIASGSWAFTNTERIVGSVYRNVTDIQALANTQVGSPGNSSTSFEIPPVTLTVGDGSSWVWGAGIANISTDLPNLTGLTKRGHVAQGTEGGSRAYDTNGGVASFAGVAGAITASGWSGYALELVGSGIVRVAADGREELVGTSVKAKRCDDTEHWHEVGSGSPSVTDDVDAGFRTGTFWVNDDGEAWLLIDNSAGAADWLQLATGGGPDLSGINFLVGTATGLLSAEIVVGTTPGGELGGTWASPTVDATHSGSTHSAATDAHIADTSDAHDASAVSFSPAGTISATDVQAAIEEVAAEAGGGGAPTGADYLVGTAQGGLSAEIVVGTSPGGELGGTWASPTVDATHSGSAHHVEDHDHDGSPTQKLAGANTHESPDTDSATSSLHHTIGGGATQAAAGNHSHGAGTGGVSPWNLTPGASQAEAAGGFQAANDCIFYPVTLPAAATITGVRIHSQTASGNVSVALYDSTGARVATSGAVACPATTAAATINFGSPYSAAAGRYYLGVSCDNTTAQFESVATARALANSRLHGIVRMTGSHPAPANISGAVETTRIPIAIGIISGGTP